MSIQLRVPDATCEHCKATIEKAVSGVDGVNAAELDLDSKLLSVSAGHDVDQRVVTRAIIDAGYSAEDA